MLVSFNKRLTPTSHSHPQEPSLGPGELGCLGLFACLTWRMASILPLSLLGFSKSVSKMLSTHLLKWDEVKAGACVRPAGSPLL